MSSGQRVDRLRQQGNVQGLCRLLTDKDVLIRRRAVVALGELRNPSAVPCLAEALQDQDDYVKRWAIDALRKIGGPEAVETLIAAMFTTQLQVASAAETILNASDYDIAHTAIQINRTIQQADWAALKTYGEEGQQVLEIIINSREYQAWPSARRRAVLRAAVEVGVNPPDSFRRELADMGLFVSGVHTVNDLLEALESESAQIRVAAAQKLGESEIEWTNRRLYRHFQRETISPDNRPVAAAIARALERLGDPRAYDDLNKQLRTGGDASHEAAYLLAEIGTEAASEILYRFATDPPNPPEYRNRMLALNALEKTGPAAVDHLRHHMNQDDEQALWLMVEIVGRSRHLETVELLGELARSRFKQVQEAALDALAALNTAEAAEMLYGLRGYVSHQGLMRALAGVTHPAGAERFIRLSPNATTLDGTVLGGDGLPLPGSQVQIIQEKDLGPVQGVGWRAVSARAITDSEGFFALSLFEAEKGAQLRLKLIRPLMDDGSGQATYETDLVIQFGASNHARIHIDRFFDRLSVDVESDLRTEPG